MKSFFRIVLVTRRAAHERRASRSSPPRRRRVLRGGAEEKDASCPDCPPGLVVRCCPIRGASSTAALGRDPRRGSPGVAIAVWPPSRSSRVGERHLPASASLSATFALEVRPQLAGVRPDRLAPHHVASRRTVPAHGVRTCRASPASPSAPSRSLRSRSSPPRTTRTEHRREPRRRDRQAGEVRARGKEVALRPLQPEARRRLQGEGRLVRRARAPGVAVRALSPGAREEGHQVTTARLVAAAALAAAITACSRSAPAAQPPNRRRRSRPRPSGTRP